MDTTRETKEVIVNGYIFTLAKLDKMEYNLRIIKPNFMGNEGWVLQSVIKQLVRTNPCCKSKYHGHKQKQCD